MGGSQEDGARLCSVVLSNRTNYSGHKLEHRKFNMNMRKIFLAVALQSTGIGYPEWL